LVVNITQSEWRSFWDQVDKSGGVDACWLWRGRAQGDFGYGGMTVGEKIEYAHRVSWAIANGPIPKGLLVLHRCDVPRCVKPSHLFLGTHAENMKDKVLKGRQHRGESTPGVVLRDAQVSEILLRYATGKESALGLAIEFGVKESTMRSIIGGRTWLHVPGPRLGREEILAIGKRNRADGVRRSKKRA
jgi:hypothetical protein